MYRVVRRTGDIFGDEPHVCEFVCDTSDDVATLPTSIAEGTGGKSKYDNQKCSAGSTAIIATNSGSNSYILNNSDVWIAQSSGSSGSGGSGDPSEDIDPRIYPLDTNGLPTGDVIVTEGIKSFGSNGVGNYGPFYKNPNITSVTLPDSMETIGNSVFYECSKLKTIKWPKNCKIATIDKKAFYNVPITVINIPDSVTAINDYAFYNVRCTSINFGNASAVIHTSAFYKCSETQINFGAGDIQIFGANIFYDNIHLISVNIPSNVRFSSNGGSSMFYGCSALETVSFDENHELKIIPSSMFYNCSKLKSITFPKSLTTLGQYSFLNTGFETFNVPDGVTRLEQGCLSYMKSLTTVNIPSSVTYTYYYPGSNYDIFQRSNAITTVNLGEDFTAELSLATQTLITQECVADIASKLHDYTGDTNTHRICFNATVYDAIPEDVMAVFTGKNWTVARSTSI